MATVTEIRYVDDVSGEQASGTVEFGIDGKSYEIDLSDANAAELRDALAVYVANARRVDGGRAARKAPAASASRQETQAIRQWARENGHTISNKGRIPSSVREAYLDRDRTPAPEQDDTAPESPAEAPEQTTEGDAPEAAQSDAEPTDEQIVAWSRERGHKNPEDITALKRANYKRSHKVAS